MKSRSCYLERKITKKNKIKQNKNCCMCTSIWKKGPVYNTHGELLSEKWIAKRSRFHGS